MKQNQQILTPSILLVVALCARATAGQPLQPAIENPLSVETLTEAVALYEQGVRDTVSFEKALVNSTSIVESATAKAFLAYCLFDVIAANDSEESVQRIYQICSEMPETELTRWQAAAAKVLVVATKALEGKGSESILLAKNALETIDFEAVEQEKALAWLVLKKSLGNGEHALRDGLKFNIANELIKMKNPREAENVWGTITNSYFRSGIADGIVDEYVSQESRALAKRVEQGRDNQAIDHAKALFDRKVEELGRSGDWNSLSLQGVLKVVSKQATNAVVAATAKVYLARCLLTGLASIHSDDQRKMQLRRIYRLGNEVSAMPAESWQSGLMAWIVASAKHLEGENEEAVAIASSALKSVDFESLEKNDDQAWLVIGKTMGKRPFILRESLNSLLEQSRMKADP